MVVALTSPPLISFVGAWLARWRGSRFVYWVMDFNPDEAIAAGWLRAGSFAARLLERMSRFSLRRARKVIALDRFMRDRIVAKGIPAEKVVALPPWSQDDHVRFDAAGREQFRARHGLQDKFVVMHSGNHSPIHPLDTLLEAAKRLAGGRNIVFCFIGGGSEFQRVQQLAGGEGNPPSPGAKPSTLDAQLPNLLCLPYQSLDTLSASLSAADLHVVVMGNAFVGLVHPCKIYNILRVGAPVLYLGPWPSHVTEIADSGANGEIKFYSTAHGDVEGLVAQMRKARAESVSPSERTPSAIRARYSKDLLLPRLISELESA
jgi:glycosyltransferase involved in cell wall biosynthesis